MNPARAALYELCAGKGTAITVMKGFGAGTLLRAESSPFDRALTPEQCCHYALTRPGVASILVGCRTPRRWPGRWNMKPLRLSRRISARC